MEQAIDLSLYVVLSKGSVNEGCSWNVKTAPPALAAEVKYVPQ